MTYSINLQTIKLLAQLSKLKITPKEEKKFLTQLKEIINYLTKIKSLNTKNIKPKYHAVDLQNVFKNEKTGKMTFTQKQALSNAPKAKNGFFVVPKILKAK